MQGSGSFLTPHLLQFFCFPVEHRSSHHFSTFVWFLFHQSAEAFPVVMLRQCCSPLILKIHVPLYTDIVLSFITLSVSFTCINLVYNVCIVFPSFSLLFFTLPMSVALHRHRASLWLPTSLPSCQIVEIIFWSTHCVRMLRFILASVLTSITAFHVCNLHHIKSVYQF